MFNSSSIRQLRTSIERTETVKKNFNLTTTSSKKVEELENKIKTLEDAKEDRNGILSIYLTNELFSS